MFQSVIEQQEWRARRLGTGAGVSLLVHAGLVAVVMFISAGVAEQVEKEPPEIYFKVPAAAPPKGNPNPPTAKAEQPKPKPKTKPKTLTQPAAIPQKPLPEAEPLPETPEEPADEELPYDPNGKLDGLTGGTCVTCEALKGVTTAVQQPTGEETVPYTFGTMTPPKLESGAQIQYTREALAAHVSGLLIVKCVITREGDVENCRVLKGLPHMNEAVLAALETRHYTPVQYQGKAIKVSYIFNIKLDLPR